MAEEGYGTPTQAATARLRVEAERLRTENEQLRIVLRQVRGQVVTHEARRVIDAALKRR